ncbi:MAG: hypothetical protein D3925_14055 [Candidatus Electrothrix sp. AR5]|nr:hypothetical protein [Candidatus Electrothrix sp. AR5]
MLIITFLAFFSWYTSWNPFAYFFEQESAPISTSTAITHPTTPEPDIELPPEEKTPEEAVAPSVIKPPLVATAQERIKETDSNTIEQDTTSE